MSDGRELSKVKSPRYQGVMGFLRPSLLFLLTRENAHGYFLLDGLTEFGFSAKQLDPSLVYRTLREMEESGWIASHIGKVSRGPQRRVYQLQPEGKTYLAELVDGLRRRRDEINNLLQTYDQELK